jgi:hypothetical protein
MNAPIIDPAFASGAWQLQGKEALVSAQDIAAMLTGCPRTNYSAGCGTNACCSCSCNRTHRGISASAPADPKVRPKRSSTSRPVPGTSELRSPRSSRPHQQEAIGAPQQWDEWAETVMEVLFEVDDA